MAKGKRIISLILFLLLLFFSNNQGAYSFTSPGGQSFNTWSYVAGSAHSGFAPDYPSIKKDWIKVRYVGGEYSYDVPFAGIMASYEQLHCSAHNGSYTSFISSSHHFLFKLRGPPLVCS